MASEYYTPVKPSANIDGQTADASDVNSISNAVETAFELLEADMTGEGDVGVHESLYDHTAFLSTSHLTTYDHTLLDYYYLTPYGEGGNNANLNIGINSGNGASMGSFNTSVGAGSIKLTTGNSNTAIGVSSGDTLTSGGYNVFVGNGSGYGLTTGSNNVYIGPTTAGGAAVTNEIVIGYSAIGHGSNTVTIGNNSMTAHYLYGTYQNGFSGGRAVYVDSDGQLGYDTSSIKYKTNIKHMEGTEWIYDLNPVTYNPKAYPDMKKYGLLAEELHEAEPSLVYLNKRGIPDGIDYVQLVPILLNEIQELNKRIEKLEGK